MIPYRIEDTLERTPWMNWLLIAFTTAVSMWLFQHPNPESVEQYFVLSDRYPLSLIGCMFAHADWMHLIGNMVFLWVFGNGVCAILGNFSYGAAYLALGVGSGLIHKLVDGRAALGASGAICGVVAMAVAFFPFARVSLFWMLGVLPRISQFPLWGVALYWTSWDVVRAVVGKTQIACWAHLGGTFCGVLAGLAVIAIGYVQFSHYDEPSLLDVILRRSRDQLRRARGGIPTSPAVGSLAVETAVAEAAAGPRKLKLRVGAGAASAAAFAATHPEPTAPAKNPAAAAEPVDAATPAVETPLPEIVAATETPAPAPAIEVQRAPSPEPVLSLRRRPAVAPAPTNAAPANSVSANSTPANVTTVVVAEPTAPAPIATLESVAVTPEQAGSADLLAVATADCFLFDGETRLGPMTAAEMQQRVHAAGDTRHWSFWQQGMADWQPVAQPASTPAPETRRGAALGTFGALGTA